MRFLGARGRLRCSKPDGEMAALSGGLPSPAGGWPRFRLRIEIRGPRATFQDGGLSWLSHIPGLCARDVSARPGRQRGMPQNWALRGHRSVVVLARRQEARYSETPELSFRRSARRVITKSEMARPAFRGGRRGGRHPQVTLGDKLFNEAWEEGRGR